MRCCVTGRHVTTVVTTTTLMHMSSPTQNGSGAGDTPDVPFTLDAFGSAPSVARSTPASPDAASLIDQISRSLEAHAPAGWSALAATFSLTVRSETGVFVVLSPSGERQVGLPTTIYPLVRALREMATASADGPWWRVAFFIEQGGEVSVDYDRGADPFAPAFVLPAADYRADFAAFPERPRPLWLAAYALNDGRQLRPAGAAVRDGLTGDGSVVHGDTPDDQWPAPSVMWARWAAMAAAFASLDTTGGAAMAPGIGVFESPTHSGSTLVRLPGERAILSGGVFDAPALESAYNGTGDLPDLYAGAPIWVADATLNLRVETGMLSFCWWYDDGHWYRGDSPDASSSMSAVPEVSSTEATATAIAHVLTADPPSELCTVSEAFVGAVETGTLTRTLVEALLPRAQGYDTDAGLLSLSVAGCFG